jgi:hypothetical protein
MWSFESGARNLLIALGLSLALGAVSGCSFAPVYGEGSVAEQTLQLNYAKPNTRLEQVVYQELELRLGANPPSEAPLVTVAVFTATRTLTKSKAVTANPVTEITATGTVTVVKDGVILQSFVRKATVSYTTNSQVLANNSAATDAGERAAKALAESIRLSLIGLLAGR